jgi:hypothetical protein
MTRKLILNLADILERKYPSGFHVPADIDISTLLEYGDDDWDHTIDIDALLEAEDQVALVWSLADVLIRRPDLTEEQAWKVLTSAREDFLHDRCHLDFIESTADGLYPLPVDAKSRLRRCAEALLRQIDALPPDERDNPAAYGQLAAKLDDLESDIGPKGGVQ